MREWAQKRTGLECNFKITFYPGRYAAEKGGWHCAPCAVACEGVPQQRVCHGRAAVVPLAVSILDLADVASSGHAVHVGGVV